MVPVFTYPAKVTIPKTPILCHEDTPIIGGILQMHFISCLTETDFFTANRVYPMLAQLNGDLFADVCIHVKLQLRQSIHLSFYMISWQCYHVIGQPARNPARPRVHIQINGQHIEAARAARLVDQHRGLPGLPEVARPVREHGHSDQMGNVMAQLGDRLLIGHMQDERCALAAVVGSSQQLVTQDERGELGFDDALIVLVQREAGRRAGRVDPLSFICGMQPVPVDSTSDSSGPAAIFPPTSSPQHPANAQAVIHDKWQCCKSSKMS